MTYGIIDIGSNTIRMNIYHVEGKHFDLLMSKKEAAGLAAYIKKGKLTAAGVDVLADVLTSFTANLDLLHVDHYRAFATASLRNTKNSSEVIAEIKKRCHVDIDLLSGVAEARLSFHGAVGGLDYDDGMYIDSGGGSTEIVLYDQKTPAILKSLPIGSLNLFEDFVEEVIPTSSEIAAISDKVKQELKAAEDKKNLFRVENLVVTGGSMRAIRKLLVQMGKIDRNRYDFDPQDVQTLLTELSAMPAKQVIRLFLKCKADRVHTLFPGLLIIAGIAKYTKAQHIQVSKNGVREGYLMEKVIGE